MSDELVTPGRYHRQTILPGVGEDGQRRLGGGHAVIVGVGALGGSVADLLARAGVGRLTLVDRDLVDRTNLQRQVLFDESDAREQMPKAEAARRRLGEINSEIEVVAHIADFTGDNAERLMMADGPPGVIVDGTDNFETRYLLNDLAVKHGIPFVYGGVIATRGMQMTVLPGQTPCLRCLFEDPPAQGTQPTCDTAGVLGSVVAIVSACQASDAMRLMLGQGDRIAPSLLEFDLWEGQRRRVDIGGARRDDCPCCGSRRFTFLESRVASGASSLCGQDAVQIAGSPGAAVDLHALAERLRTAGAVDLRSFMVRCALSDERADADGRLTLTVFRDGRAIVGGTSRTERARTVYARYVGS